MNFAAEAAVEAPGAVTSTVYRRVWTLPGVSEVPEAAPPVGTPKVSPVPPGATTAGTLVPNVTPMCNIGSKCTRREDAPTVTTDPRPVTGMVRVILFALVPVG